ncbi:hypothetical protein D1007_32828 [Hordeum vulgare]|nr:hypothetical protein D1007_32828 [Hordeum vulgare]
MDPFFQEYLGRIDAMLDTYTDATRSLTEKVHALVVAWRPDLEKRSSVTVVLHGPPAPTLALKTTTELSAPILDVPYSTTMTQEVLEVNLDVSPAYISRTAVTCSTDGSTQVVAVAVAKADEIHDAA